MTKSSKSGLTGSAVQAVYLVIALVSIAAWSIPGYAQYGVPAAAVVSVGSSEAFTGTGPDDSILTIRKRVDEVNVLFIATDRHGKFVRNLNQNDFSIFHYHKPVESIIAFRRETDLPIELGLLMDVSGSVQGRFGFEKEAATGFLQHIDRKSVREGK